MITYACILLSFLFYVMLLKSKCLQFKDTWLSRRFYRKQVRTPLYLEGYLVRVKCSWTRKIIPAERNAEELELYVSTRCKTLNGILFTLGAMMLALNKII